MDEMYEAPRSLILRRGAPSIRLGSERKWKQRRGEILVWNIGLQVQTSEKGYDEDKWDLVVQAIHDTQRSIDEATIYVSAAITMPVLLMWVVTDPELAKLDGDLVLLYTSSVGISVLFVRQAYHIVYPIDKEC